MKEQSVSIELYGDEILKIIDVIKDLNSEEERFTYKTENVKNKIKLTVFANDPLHFYYLGIKTGEALK